MTTQEMRAIFNQISVMVPCECATETRRRVRDLRGGLSFPCRNCGATIVPEAQPFLEHLDALEETVLDYVNSAFALEIRPQ